MTPNTFHIKKIKTKFDFSIKFTKVNNIKVFKWQQMLSKIQVLRYVFKYQHTQVFFENKWGSK